MRHLAIDLVRHGTLLEHDHDGVHQLHDRRDVEVHQLVGTEPRRRNVHPVFIHRSAALAYLLDQREQGTAEGNKAVEAVARQRAGAGAEEVFRVGVGVADEIVGTDHDDRAADGVEHQLRGVFLPRFGLLSDAHAATGKRTGLSLTSASRRPATTSAGTSERRIRCRNSGETDCAWRSRYQPRCLRACRTPLSTP